MIMIGNLFRNEHKIAFSNPSRIEVERANPNYLAFPYNGICQAL